MTDANLRARALRALKTVEYHLGCSLDCHTPDYQVLSALHDAVSALAGEGGAVVPGPPVKELRVIVGYFSPDEEVDFAVQYREWTGRELDPRDDAALKEAARREQGRDHIFSKLVLVEDWLDELEGGDASREGQGWYLACLAERNGELEYKHLLRLRADDEAQAERRLHEIAATFYDDKPVEPDPSGDYYHRFGEVALRPLWIREVGEEFYRKLEGVVAEP